MSIRILGGFASKFEIKVHDSSHLRPTQSMLKRKIFDRFQDLSEYTFVDCFGGTGAMSLEAVSRGAREVYSIESNSKFYRFLNENVKRFNEKHKENYKYEIKTYLSDALKMIKKLNLENKKVIFYIDPPFEKHDLYFNILEEVRDHNCLVWIESDLQKGLKPDEISEFLKKESVKVYTQGSNFISYFDFT